MSDLHERAVTRALDEYSRGLRILRPSRELDARVDEAIKTLSDGRGARRFLRRPLAWVVAAASIAAVSGGIALLLAGDGRGYGAPEDLSAEVRTVPQLHGADVSALAAGQVSLWPAESTIFRVKASLASMPGVPPPGGVEGERQFWVDVRIANDGTMRIMQVIPADHGRGVPFE